MVQKSSWEVVYWHNEWGLRKRKNEKRHTFSVALFQHVFEYASLNRALLSERGAALMITRLQREVAALMQQQVIEALLALATVKLPAHLLAEHCAASLWSLVAWWLRNDFPKSIE